MIAQVLGSMLGALLVSAATPPEFHSTMSGVFWEESLSNFSGFLLEAMLTFFLVFVVFATYFDPIGLGKLVRVISALKSVLTIPINRHLFQLGLLLPSVISLVGCLLDHL